jgi:transcriptional regulator with XRE-family HTH domain
MLSAVLKAIRNHRRMTVQDVAKRMGLHKRTYERFEAGEGVLKVERIFSFALATNSDPYALLTSVRLGSPQFALACIDNKLVALMVAHARDLFLTHGADMPNLHAQMIVEALTPGFAAMRGELDNSREASRKWLDETPDEEA